MFSLSVDWATYWCVFNRSPDGNPAEGLLILEARSGLLGCFRVHTKEGAGHVQAVVWCCRLWYRYVFSLHPLTVFRPDFPLYCLPNVKTGLPTVVFA